MNNITELDLEKELEQIEEGPSGPSGIYERSLEIIKESMGHVVQEILINLEDGSAHMVYVTKIDISPKGEVSVEFGTPSETRKAELAEHVEKCVIMQIQEELNKIMNKPKKWFW